MNILIKTCFLCLFTVPSQAQKLEFNRSAQQLSDILFKNSTSTSRLDTLKKSYSMFNMPLVRPDFYSTHLSFFCKQEIKIEKLTTIPLKIRLGSISYCNYLEQKTGYKLPE